MKERMKRGLAFVGMKRRGSQLDRSQYMHYWFYGI